MLTTLIMVFLGVPSVIIVGLVLYFIIGGAIWHCVETIRTGEIENIIAGSLGLSLIIGMVLLVCKLFIEIN